MAYDKPTTKQIHALKIEKAHGKIVVLAVGIGDYDAQSGFDPLKTAVNDAVAVRDAFLDVHQLNADTTRVSCLTSGGKKIPTKGEIFKQLKAVAATLAEDERLLFYFSGHGQKIQEPGLKEKYFLVPQDVYDAEDPDALVDFDKILDIINACEAKQKFIVLDACFSGPTPTGAKFLPVKQSKKFYIEYLQETKGTYQLTSSAADQPSFVHSPNPKLSRFTYFFITALRGESKALDGSMLTLASLYQYLSVEMKLHAKSFHVKQTPGISQDGLHVPVLGDFNISIISPDQFDLSGSPVQELCFTESEEVSISEILTSIKYYQRYSPEYLEGVANKNLNGYLEEEFSSKASRLRKALQLTSNDVYVDGASILFPNGSLAATYEGKGKKSGEIEYNLIFGEEWFTQLTRINTVIESLAMAPDYITFHLKKKIKPLSLIPGLEAKGWTITSENQGKIEAEKDGYRQEFGEYGITFSGFVPKELFGVKTDEGKLAAAVFALLTQ